MKSIKTQTGYIGMHVSAEMAQCIRLYAFSQDLSISQVLRSIIRSWIDSTCVTEEILVDGIVTNAVQEWGKQKFVDHSVDLHTFRDRWILNLEKKLSPPICDQIVKEFNRRTSDSSDPIQIT